MEERVTKIFSVGLLIAISFFGVAAARPRLASWLQRHMPSQCRTTRSRSGAGTRRRRSCTLRWARESSCLKRLPMLACLQLMKLHKWSVEYHWSNFVCNRAATTAGTM